MFQDIVKKIYSSEVSDEIITKLGIFLEVNAVIGVNIYFLRKCFYSFMLEFQADWY